MFHQPKTQDPIEQKRKALRAKNLMLDGYKYKVIESTLRVSMRTLRRWAEIHGISLAPIHKQVSIESCQTNHTHS